VIKRFDIQDNVKLAVEDFSVLMGKGSDEKYQSSYEAILKATQLYTKSQQQVDRVYRYILFNCLIGNGDAHLKNFAVQYDQLRNNIILTPPYDITHTLIYPTIDNKMALKLNKTKLFPCFAQLIQFGERHGVTKSKMLVIEIVGLISSYLNKSKEINLLTGLKKSIEQSLSHAKTGLIPVKGYPQDKKRKYD
jgi:serine/threonine-protein kinase HipA